MFVVALMVWGLATGVHFKQPHRKIRCAMFLADHQTHPYAMRAGHGQRFWFDFLWCSDQHGKSFHRHSILVIGRCAIVGSLGEVDGAVLGSSQ